MGSIDPRGFVVSGSVPFAVVEPRADPVSPATRRIALCLQYDGATYCGWQRQPRDPSIQETLEVAIAALDPRRPVRVQAAGRTDTGVHAAAQVVHFDA